MTDPIVVGVDGSLPAERALLWAADEAAVRDAQLLIVHCGEVLTRQARAHGDARPVAVGVSGTPSGRDALDFAFAEAERADAPLVAVRSCAEVKRAGSDDSAIRRQHQALLTELAEAAWANTPGVEVVTELSSASVYETLRDVAARASLVVLGCRHAADNHSARLGPVPSRLLHSSPCPMAIVGRRVALATTRVTDDLALAGQS